MFLKRPLVSEKSMLIARTSVYTFEVSLNARKEEIKKIVEEKFKVNVVSVKTLKVKGKTKMQRSRKGYYITSPVKKALVQLEKGQKIALFENVAKEGEEVKITTADDVPVVKEKKSLLGRTRIKVEKEATLSSGGGKKSEKVAKKKDENKKTAKQKSIDKKRGSK
jgi:large subunit ribosomal protein L23